MIRSSKRITRKDIRRPDQFVSLSNRFFHYLRKHKKPVAASAALVAALLLALWIWDLYRVRQNRLAAEEYSKAVALYHGGKYREALEALGRVSIYRSTIYSRLGLLYQANSYMGLKEKDKALLALEELIQRERKDTFIRQLALLTLAYAKEDQGKCEEAVRSFEEATKIPGPFSEEALLGKARCSIQTQNLKEALSSYRQYLTNYPATERIGEISLMIQQLEMKVSEGGGGK